MTLGGHALAVSVDLDEWYHSRRWVDGEQARAEPDIHAVLRRIYGRTTPIGEIIDPTQRLLDLFDRYRCRCTFFILGEVAQFYPYLVREIASRGHEIACHGLHHVDMTVLGPERFARQLDQARQILEETTSERPVGYRAPNLVYDPWATKILEDRGFVYDSTVCASRPIGGKYQGWANAPTHPYHPSYDAIGRPGTARLIEVPLPAFPVLKLSAGSGILTRLIGLSWTMIALGRAIRKGNTAFYLHPWEVGPKPTTHAHRLRSALFFRHTGPWMMRAVERILERFEGRTITVRESAESLYRSAAI